MNEKKISLSTFFLIISVIVIIIMAIYIFIEKRNSSKTISELEANSTKLQSTVDNLQGKIDTISNTINSATSNSTSNNSTKTANNSNEEISYIVVEVEDTNSKEGIAYKSKKITDRQVINNFMEIVKKAVEFNGETRTQDIGGDASPNVQVYLTNGENYTLMVGDNADENGQLIHLIAKTNPKNENEKKLYKSNIDLAKYVEDMYNNRK